VRQIYEENAGSKPRDLFDPTDRIVALLRMLGNGASDTEIIGAARALDRTLSRMRACPSEGQWRWMTDISDAVDQRIPPEMRKRKHRAA
jgi:hypothetical protein